MYSNDLQLVCNPVVKMMQDKMCCIHFSPIDQNTAEQVLLSIPDEKTCGVDFSDVHF